MGDVSGRLALRDAGAVAGGHGSLAARQPARFSSSSNLPICRPWTCRRGAGEQPGRALRSGVRYLLSQQRGGVRQESDPRGARGMALPSAQEMPELGAGGCHRSHGTADGGLRLFKVYQGATGACC